MPEIKQQIKRRMTLLLLHSSPLFDENWYRAQTGLPADTDAAAHYLDGGWRTCDPSLRFRQEPYLEANRDVREARVCPLAHYLLDGRRQHRLLYPGMIENHYHRYAVPRALVRGFFRLVCLQAVRRNRGARLLVVVHIYYEEAIGEIIEYLKNLGPYSYDLVVTTTEDRNVELIRREMLQFRKSTVFRVLPNRGFDIYPFLEALNDRDLSRYDLVLKLQTKRHFSRKGDLAEDTLFRGREWFAALFRAVIGPRNVHLNIDRMTRDSGVSLIAAKSLFWKDTPRRKRLTENRLLPFGLSLPEDYTFVAGSCFWVKASRLHSARDLGLSAEDFGPPVRGAFSLAHALERYISGSIPEEEKVGIPVCRFRAWVSRRYLCRRREANNTLLRAMKAEDPSLLCAALPEEAAPAEQKRMTIAFAVTETGPEAVAGDLFTAKELAAALEKKGVRCVFVSERQPDGEWYHLTPEVDVLISMLQHYDPQNIRNENPNLLVAGWARNWFHAWAEAPWIDEYDLLLASSRTACRLLEEQLHRPDPLLPIATNPERFYPAGEKADADDGGAGAEYDCDYCFSGNHFGAPREIEEELDPASLPYRLNIYGNGWDKDERFAPWCRGHLPYDKIPLAYRHTRIVLDDATPSTRETGSVNSRVFDALAAGCLVLTNNEIGAKETFGGLLPTFNSRETLKAALELYLGNEELRRQKADELRRFVLEHHTYDIRAEQLGAILREQTGKKLTESRVNQTV